MVTFDQALPALVRICEAAPGFTSLKQCCVVRDVRGRLRLVIEPDPRAAVLVDVEELATALEQELQKYFVAPIWSTGGARRPEESRLARSILQEAELWSATYEDPATGQTEIASGARWRKFERRLSKHEWLETAEANFPWELDGTNPGIVTFYSFKGGVGRTTALIACAWQLARAGKNVVAIDLDLEAPGLGALLLEVEGERGVLDFLVDYLATGSRDLTGLVAPATTLGSDGARVRVITAGALNPLYLEKLGRLDFISANPQGIAQKSPAEQALWELLQAVRKLSPAPDYILMDSRAGLHDLAGLSLHRLAHVDVIFGRASEQSYRGLDLTLKVLSLRKGKDNLQCIVAQTLVPTEGIREAIAEEEEFRRRSYQSFVKHVYSGEKAKTITETDTDASHSPIVLRYDNELWRFATLSAIESAFFKPGFVSLRSTIEEFCMPRGDKE